MKVSDYKQYRAKRVYQILKRTDVKTSAELAEALANLFDEGYEIGAGIYDLP